MGAVEGQAKPAVDDEPDWNVTDGEGCAGYMRADALKMILELTYLFGDLFATLLDEPGSRSLVIGRAPCRRESPVEEGSTWIIVDRSRS